MTSRSGLDFFWAIRWRFLIPADAVVSMLRQALVQFSGRLPRGQFLCELA